MKTTCKNGEIEQKIAKDHRTPSQSNVKEREGCKTAVVNVGMPGEIKRQRVGRVGTNNLTRTRVIKSVCAVKVDEVRTGRCQSRTRNTLAETKLRRTQCVLAKLSVLFADTNLIQSTPQGMGFRYDGTL
ncbi:hypothetical protein IW261DRAFT_1577210 [Armillaria novae-zelandiae]|uniref:Uncharacterized protein n=1 Tax=Armillaria novae-zelandiae TaxID=153914 RepID=A0AA39TNG0_9AGAR|nr:hypothetical protein IW261DRAFT_1577210 [Armillaria novae-zelandiae]